MSLFEKIFRPKEATKSDQVLSGKPFFYELNNYRPVYHDHKGEIYECELVRACIDARARHISKLKIMTYGTAQTSLQNKLRQGPNQWQTWPQFLYRLSTILDINNTSFVVPVFDAGMVITGYYPVIPKRCEIVEYQGEEWLRYKFAHGETAAVEFRKCCMMTKFQYKDDFFGEKNTMDETLDLMSIYNQGIKDGVKNAASYRFMAQVNNFTKADDLKNERLRFSQENLTTDAEAGGLLLFPNTYQNIEQIKNSTFEVDPEQKKLIDENVFRYFGCNDKILKNEANGEELDAFFNGAIEPWSIQFSDGMTKAIWSERERAGGSKFLATANRLQYMSVPAKVQMAKELGDRGAILIDEIRDLFNYPPLPNGAGQVAPVRGEYKRAEELGGSDNASENE